jgi:hypothetical protein
MASLFFRRIIGKLTKSFYPGYSSCRRCERVWAICQPHEVNFNEGSACFVFCEDCWGETNSDYQLPHYKDLVEKWMSYGYDNHNGQSWDDLWDTLESNVMAGK